MGKFMNSPVPDDPDAQLLRVAACSLIFSAEEKDFRSEHRISRPRPITAL